MSNISKVAKTKMEITADYQKLSDLNVAFYNQDINTSILQFNVTRNDAPVPLGKVNIEGYIVLLAADGSRIQDNVTITNELNGVIQYVIPTEFLKHTGKVLGQVYIAVKGRDDTAVMRKISFDIKQDLLTGFSSTKKLEYIKTFDDLQTQIKQRVEAIEEAIANGADYVTAMEKAAEKGRKDIQAVATKATTDVNKAATDATKKITDTSNTAVATVNAKGDAVLKAFNENGQVPKITADDGRYYYNLTDNKSDILATVISESGFKTGYAHYTVLDGLGNNRSFRFTSYYYPTNGYIHAIDTAGQSHIRVCNGGVWGAWKSIIGSNTGWLPLPLLNGVTAATPCFYRFYSTNGIYYLSFKGVLNTLSTKDVTIAKLPADVATKIDRPLTWVGNTSVSASTARFNRWVVEMDGTIKFAISNFGTDGESGAWNPLDVTLTL